LRLLRFCGSGDGAVVGDGNRAGTEFTRTAGHGLVSRPFLSVPFEMKRVRTFRIDAIFSVRRLEAASFAGLAGGMGSLDINEGAKVAAFLDRDFGCRGFASVTGAAGVGEDVTG